MQSILSRYLITAVICLLYSLAAHSELSYRWQDSFSRQDKVKLKQWVDEAYAGLEQLVGTPSFDITIEMHRSSSREPVAFGHTRRGSRQGVSFYVNPSYTLQQFRKDWKASHELSHLIIPYLGESNAWFAEGFASFMQFQVMQQMGVLNEDQAFARYMERFNRAKRGYDYPELPFARAASRLRSRGKYPTMYWGGAAYFWQINHALVNQHQISLIDVLTDYLDCCRHRGHRINSLVQQFDQLSDSNLFSTTLSRFKRAPGFPKFRM